MVIFQDKAKNKYRDIWTYVKTGKLSEWQPSRIRKTANYRKKRLLKNPYAKKKES